MLLQSLHTHSLYDDGQDTLARMAQNAEAAGLDALGFSGHSPLPFANDWAIDQSCLADYLREARSLQADFRGRFSLYCGLEWDSCSPLPEQKLDYLIGSVHYFPALPDGTRFTVDGSAQLLAQCAQVQFGGDMAAQADCYYALVARLAEVPQVDIVGHFDLITKFDEPHTRYPIVPPSARAAMERLIRVVDARGQQALTRYRVLETAGQTALLELHPMTGRTHQLRLHCMASGFPILGDPQYTGPEAKAYSDAHGLQFQQLCAARLVFPHPMTGERIEICSKQTVFFPKD